MVVAAKKKRYLKKIWSARNHLMKTQPQTTNEQDIEEQDFGAVAKAYPNTSSDLI